MEKRYRLDETTYDEDDLWVYSEEDGYMVYREDYIYYSKKDGSAITGVVYEEYDDGLLKGEIEFKNGRGNGFFRSWHRNGQLWTKGTYVDGNKYGLAQEWWDNGQ
jgi:antitoxin component YwqK of YwqJK toxin-antitoxin module